MTCHPPFDLNPLAFPEMTRAVPAYAHPARRAVLMRFDAEDAFNLNDHPKTWNLPDSAVALLSRAGEWFARNPECGFVPADMLARFSSDPVQAVEELLRRGLWRRVKGGYQFTDWGQFGKTAEQRAQEEADAETERTVKSESGRRGNHKRWHEDMGKTAPGCEFCQAPAPGNETDIAGAIGVRSGATPIDRSDQNLSSSKKSESRSRSDARASDADDPAIVAAVASAICSEVAFLPNDDQARAVVATYEKRARKAGTDIGNKVAYYAASVAKAAREGKLAALLLLPAPAPAPDPAGVLGPPDPEPEVWDPDYHEFSPKIRGTVCRCGSTETSPKHYRKRTGTDG